MNGAAGTQYVREYSYPLIAGATLRICIPWRPPDGSVADNFTGEFVVRPADASGKEYRADADSVKRVGGDYVFTLGPAFTQALPPGEHQYEAAAVAEGERYTMQAGFLIVRELGKLTQAERDLQCARDMLSNRLASGGDLNSYSLPGGLSGNRMSVGELRMLIVQLENEVNQARGGLYRQW